MALNCPVCSRRVDAPFVEIPGVPVHVSTLHRTPDGARTAYRGDLELEFCESCGFIWNAAYDAELVTYDTAYEASLDHSPAFVDYVSSLAERLVERYDLHDRRVVEIGCGQADFLRRLCDAGGNEGIGYDPAYVGPERDGRVTVHRELYSEETVGGAAPDFICCRHVLEHVERPLEFVRSLRRTLHARRGTPVYFEVPNGEYQLSNGVVWDMIYAHFSTFTAPSLRALFELGGFEVRRDRHRLRRPVPVGRGPPRPRRAPDPERRRGRARARARRRVRVRLRQAGPRLAPARRRLRRRRPPRRPLGRGSQGREPAQRARAHERHRPGGRRQPAQAGLVRPRLGNSRRGAGVAARVRPRRGRAREPDLPRRGPARPSTASASAPTSSASDRT